MKDFNARYPNNCLSTGIGDPFKLARGHPLAIAPHVYRNGAFRFNVLLDTGPERQAITTSPREYEMDCD